MKNSHIYQQDIWLYPFEVREKLKEKYGVYPSLNYIGRIAKRKGLVKGEGYYKRYHRDLVKVVYTQMKDEGRIK